MKQSPDRVWLIGLIALLSLLAAPPQTAAQTQGWLPPIEISQPPLPEGASPAPDERRYGSSWFADMAIGPDGSAMISWYSGIALGGEAANSLDLLMLRTQRDGRWAPINEIIAPAVGGFTVRNSIAIGRDGKLHAIYRGGTNLFYVAAPWEEAWSARAWSQPQILTFGSAYYNALVSDNDGNLHAFWSEAVVDEPLKPNKICPNCSDLFYRRSLDGGRIWQPAVNLSLSAEGENRPMVRVDSQNRIHLVYDEGVDWYAGAGNPKAGVYRRSDDNGATWSDPIRFTLPPAAVADIERAQAAEQAQRPGPTPTPAPTPGPDQPRGYIDGIQQTALAVDSAGNPAVVFRGTANNLVYFQRSLDGGDTWEPPVRIPNLLARSLNDNNLDVYAPAYDGADTFHLLVVGFDARTFNPNEPTNPRLHYLRFDGTSWSGPTPVIDNDLYPEYPKIQVYNGNQLRAVWFTRSREDLFQSEKARYRVWYSELEVAAPALTPLPFFTPIPTAAPSATAAPPTATPLPTPLPGTALAAPPLDQNPSWEGRALSTILVALVPAIGIIGAVALIRLLIARRNRP